MSGATFVSDVAAAAVGQWPGLLAELGIEIPSRGKHGPCPACGGQDRFRLDDKGGRGTFICNQCGAGDGLDLVARVTGKSTKEAAKLVPMPSSNGNSSSARRRPAGQLTSFGIALRAKPSI